MPNGKFRNFFLFLKLISDILVIPVSFVAGYALKFKLYVIGLGPQIRPDAQVEEYTSVLWYVIVLWLAAFLFTGMYRRYSGPLARMQELMAITTGVLFGTFELMAFTFLYPVFPESRSVVAYAAFIAIVLLSLERWVISGLQIYLHRLGFGNKRAIIIGAEQKAQRLAERIINYPELGFNYIGFVFDHKPKSVIYPLKNKMTSLGKTNQLEKIIKKHHVEAIFLADANFPQPAIYELAHYCRKKNIHFRFAPTAYLINLEYDTFDAINLFGIKKLEFSFFKKIQKRLFDLALVIPLIIIFSPLMAFITLIIKLTSPGPVLYRQPRVTEDGREFNFIKFRSMSHDVEKGVPVLSTVDQKHRTTLIGYILRKTSLDELPQLFNVLNGDMSLVGPRPERPFFHKKYLQEIPHWEDRLAVKGGITGWAQLNGRAQLTALPLEKLEYDLYYIENWNILFDIKVLLNTIGHVLLQKDVY